MSSPGKGGLKGGFQLASNAAHNNSGTQESHIFFPPSPSPKKLKTNPDFFCGTKSPITPSNQPAKHLSNANQSINAALRLQFQESGFSGSNSSLDLISNDVQRILQEDIDFVSAKNPQNALLLNVQKKCVNLSSVKLVAFASSTVLRAKTALVKAKMIEDENLRQNGASVRLTLGNCQQASQQNGSPSKSGSDDQLPEPKRSFYDEERIRLDWARQIRIGAGLVNAGNTCFLNATLQCLAYTPALYNYLTTDNHRKTCFTNGFCVICELEDTIRNMFSSQRPIQPRGLTSNIKAFAKSLNIGRQEDAHEFLRFVVEAMRKSALDGQNLKTLDMYSQETTIASRLFGGFYRSRVTCLTCKHPSNVYDPFMDIPVEVKNVSRLEDALQNFIQPENLNSPNNLYNCEQCKKMCPATKQVTVHKPPNILTFQLKRFLFNNFSSFSKIDKPITYPEFLDFRPYISRETQSGPLRYKLYAVLVHLGSSCHSGHYFAYVRGSNQSWHRMDDCQVQTVGRDQALNQKAYLLFYTRMPSEATNGCNGSPLKLTIPSPLQKPNIFNGQKNGEMKGNDRLKPPPVSFSIRPKSTIANIPAEPSVTGNGPALNSSAPTIHRIGSTIVSEKPKPPFFQPRSVIIKSPAKPVSILPVSNLKLQSLVPYPSDEEEDEKATAPITSQLLVEPEVRSSLQQNEEKSRGLISAAPIHQTIPPTEVNNVPECSSEATKRPAEIDRSSNLLNRMKSPSPQLTLDNLISETVPEEVSVKLSLPSPVKRKKKKNKRRHPSLVNSVASDQQRQLSVEEINVDLYTSDGIRKKRKKKRRKNKRLHTDSPASSSSSSVITPVEWVEKNAVELISEPTRSTNLPLVGFEPQSEPVRNSLKSFTSRKELSVYGSEVQSWGGDRSILDKEEDLSRQEKRKKLFEDDNQLDDLDVGRQKKIKHHVQSGPYNNFRRNEFQRVQNDRSADSIRNKGFRPPTSSDSQFSSRPHDR